MLRVPAGHVLAHVCPGPGPEAGEVRRHLDRSAGGRQEVHDDRHPSVGHRRVDRGAEQVLDPRRDGRVLARVVDGNGSAAGHDDRGGDQAIQLRNPVVADEVPKGTADVDPFEVGAAGRTRKTGRQPVVERPEQTRRR